MIDSPPNVQTHSRKEIWSIFDRIAHRYDLLNQLLSFGQDRVWRNKLALCLRGKKDLHLLDLATGTGDQLLSICKKGILIQSGVGMDMSEKMLEIGRKKVAERKWEGRIALQRGDAMDIPLENNRFDAVTISFGIRNVVNVVHALKEMYRVLKPGGRVLVLECSLPPNRFVRSVYLFYFRNILPRMGSLISGDSYAYRYLNETVETFPCGQDFCDMMLSAGLVDARATPLTFGIATIYEGTKPGFEDQPSEASPIA
ncbi:MAG: bifunctional demethylmenaquinone methyltransferase/2-methoxy-6-polyprenyl-1,4-benzoquinol methylase UbiE [Kiritimatiellae bacterium]|nr:bifunctional demethylmenaquinone methyltransferase/2-methoxy-6-polyprenyl-1,4-benzoquinol methylase UbiE [Kiritimatiellia bacterium]